MSSVVGASGAGGGGGRGGRGGGDGRNDRLKQKVDETIEIEDDEGEDEDAEYGEEGGGGDEDGGAEEEGSSCQAVAAGGAARRGVGYRGVRKYSARDGNYRTTYVSCLNSKDSPHNNRQIWLGRYYEARAAAMAYDVFSCFNHHDTLVNFPELLHLYAQFVPRRGLAATGLFQPITASDLERIKHIGLGIIRAFYPDSCAAIHTRRNQKALPAASYPHLSPHQRQTAAALQASYHSQIEEHTRTQVLRFLATQRALAAALADPAAAAAAGGVAAAAAAGGAAAATGPAPQPSAILPQPAPPHHQAPSLTLPPSLPAGFDFSSIHIPISSTQFQHIAPSHPTIPNFSAIQAPQQHRRHSSVPRRSSARRSIPARTSSPTPRSIGHVRRAPTSPDTLRRDTLREYGESSHAFSGHFPPQYRPPFNPYGSFLPSQESTFFDASAFSPTPPTPPHVNRPEPTHVQSSPEPSILRSLGIIPPATTDDPGLRWNPLIRSNIDPRDTRTETSKRVSFDRDPYQAEAPTMANEERMRAERLQNEAGPSDTASFPLLQRLRELDSAGVPYPMFSYDPFGRDREMLAATAPSTQRPSYNPIGRDRENLVSTSQIAPPILRRSNSVPTGHSESLDVLRQGRHQSISAFSSYIRPTSQASDHPAPLESPPNYSYTPVEEEQRVVPLRRQSPEELPLYDVFERQASAWGGASNERVTQAGGGYERRPPSTVLGLGVGGINPSAAYIRPPLLPDLNERASSEGSSNTNIDIEELERVATLAHASRSDNGPRPHSPPPP